MVIAEAGQDGIAVLAELSRGLRVRQNGPLAIVRATLIDGTGSADIPNTKAARADTRVAASIASRG